MYFEETRLYETLTLTPFHKVSAKVRELTDAGRDLTVRSDRGRTYLHIVAENAEKFNDPRALPAAYALALAGVDPGVKDDEGNTCLHVLSSQRCHLPPWRLMIALLRCGADPEARNNQGQTARVLLQQNQHANILLHFYTRYTPVLLNAATSHNPDLKLVKKLLNSWFRVKVHQNGNVFSMATAAKQQGAGKQIVSLLRQNEETNEFALATLAGSCKRMEKIFHCGQIDINTRDHSYQYYHPRSRQVRPKSPRCNYQALDSVCSADLTNQSVVPPLRDALSSHPPRTICSTVIDSEADPLTVPVDFLDVNGDENIDSLLSGIPDVKPDDPNYNVFDNFRVPLADPTKFPEVPQPLLAAAWEQENYDVIEMLMSFGVDTSVPYTNQTDKEPKPLFFHTLSGRPRPQTRTIVHRVLRSSDLQRKDRKGKTILWDAIVQNKSAHFITTILDYGVDLASRDYKGRTARDYAESKRHETYVQIIDNYILETILKRSKDKIERMVLKGYNHIQDQLQSESEAARLVVHKLEENRLYKEMAAYLATVTNTQKMSKRLFRAIDNAEIKVLRHFATPSLGLSQNKCGHTYLHHALLTRNRGVIEFVLERYRNLTNIPDNMLRTPLHYCHLLYGRDHPVTDLVGACQLATDNVKDGAVTESVVSSAGKFNNTDVYGRVPSDYLQATLSTHEYQSHLADITEFESRIILREMNFDKQLEEAITAGDLSALKALMSRAGKNADMRRYSRWLFICVDRGQPDLAAYLIKCGCNPDVWKQLEECDPSKTQACADKLCRHPVTSIYEHAQSSGFPALAKYIEKIRKSRTKADENDLGQMAYFEGAA